MNNEQRFARQVCFALDHASQDLDAMVTERLRAAREQALAHHPLLARETEIVGSGGTALMQGEPVTGHPVRLLLAILALMLGVTFAYYWNGFSEADDNEEIDSALLADDLPPKAYLDPGFQAWLSHYTQESLR